jgi:hypothetical protein
MNQILKAIIPSALLLSLTACGGGGGGTSANQTPPSTSKTATISFSVISTARLTAPVQGVQISALLPAGVTVATDAGSTTLSSAALATGNGITSANRQVYGTYSAAIRKVKITVVTTEDTFRGGEFAKLTVSYPATTTLTTTDFTSANAPLFPFFEAGGYVLGSGSVDLTGKLRASLGVVFN